MAKKKTKAAKKKSSKSGIRKTVVKTATSVIDEIDKAREVVVREIREGFDVVSNRVTVAEVKRLAGGEASGQVQR